MIPIIQRARSKINFPDLDMRIGIHTVFTIYLYILILIRFANFIFINYNLLNFISTGGYNRRYYRNRYSKV